MSGYDVELAQKEYLSEVAKLRNNQVELSENQSAILFTKILLKQKVCAYENILFCGDNEFFVSKTPTGYDVVGYYISNQEIKTPFNMTVCKVDEQWYPSRRYIAADTKSCSISILLWVLLLIGCSLMGILMYYLMSAAIGI